MMTAQNHYWVLGVSRSADQSQIRAAYVALLKRYHPDKASASEALENADQVQQIVGAYRTLKDPRTRAAYDAALRRMVAPIPSFGPTPTPLRKVRRPKRRFRLDTDTVAYVAMIVVAAVGLHLLVSRVLEWRVPHVAHRLLMGNTSVRDAPIHPQLEMFVRNAAMMSAAEASNYSARCFAAARRSRSPVAADPCVGFDMAYVYWRETMGGPLVDDAYFQPVAMSTRASQAFSGLGPFDATARVQSVRAATLRAIMQSPIPADQLAVAFLSSDKTLKPVPARQASVERPPQ